MGQGCGSHKPGLNGPFVFSHQQFTVNSELRTQNFIMRSCEWTISRKPGLVLECHNGVIAGLAFIVPVEHERVVRTAADGKIIFP
jgi:hypothetical protein